MIPMIAIMAWASCPTRLQLKRQIKANHVTRWDRPRP